MNIEELFKGIEFNQENAAFLASSTPKTPAAEPIQMPFQKPQLPEQAPDETIKARIVDYHNMLIGRLENDRRKTKTPQPDRDSGIKTPKYEFDDLIPVDLPAAQADFYYSSSSYFGESQIIGRAIRIDYSQIAKAGMVKGIHSLDAILHPNGDYRLTERTPDPDTGRVMEYVYSTISILTPTQRSLSRSIEKTLDLLDIAVKSYTDS